MIQPGHAFHLDYVFAFCARYFADKPAIVQGDVQRTHGELYKRGLRLASGFESLGLRRQDRIAVLSMNSIEYMETFAAGWSSGIIVATINIRLAAAEVLYILNDVEPHMLIVEAQYLPLVEGIRAQVRGLEHIVVIGGEGHDYIDFESLINNAPADRPSFSAGEDDIASLLYTSGTTGRPKGCILGQKEMAFNAQLLTLTQGNTAEDRFLCVMPLFHIGAVAVVLSLLSRGGTVFIHRQFDPVAVIDCLEKDRITQILLAPTMVQMVLDCPQLEGRDLSALQMVMYSAAPMPSTVLRRGMERLGPVFLHLMGSSEGCAITYMSRSLHRPDGSAQDQARLTSVGFAFPHVGLRVVDDDGRDCPAGEPGELLIKSPILFRGYWNNSIATSEAIRDGWFYSGDIARFDEDGFVYLVDRKKDMIISGGENIYSREVEEAIIQHPQVSEVAVIGLPDESWGETVCAVVVPVAGAQLSEAQVIDHCRELIASYKKPRAVRFVSELPKIASGKVDKKVLRAEHSPN